MNNCTSTQFMKNVKRLFWMITLLSAHYLSIAQTSKTPVKDPVKPAEVAAEKKSRKEIERLRSGDYQRSQIAKRSFFNP